MLQLIESHKSKRIRVFVARKTTSYKTFSIIEGVYQLCSNICVKGKDFSITISGSMEKMFHSGENRSSIQVFLLLIFSASWLMPPFELERKYCKAHFLRDGKEYCSLEEK